MLKNIDELHKYMDSYRKTEDSLSSIVKINHYEVLKLVVKDLINKRNCPTNKIKDSFDKVLRYYLTEDDFQKYVIDKKKIK